MMARTFTWFAALLVAVVLTLMPAAPAQAHWADLAVAEIDVDEGRVQVNLTFPTRLVGDIDHDRNGLLSAEEVRARRADLERFLLERITLRDRGTAGRLSVTGVWSPPSRLDQQGTPGTHSTVRLVYTWPQPLRELTIRYELFLPGVPTASALATIRTANRVQTVVFTAEHRQTSVRLARNAIWAHGWSFLVLGVRHIITGYDHILFLLTLLLLGGGLTHLLKTATAFTAAHSVTLSLATANIVTLPSRLVESVIALSIAYVAAENLWRRDRALRSRWLVTFGFGLIHGLGFATILQEMSIPRPNLALSLAGFNLGVEVGQVFIVIAVWTGLQALRRFRGEILVRRWASALAVAAGLFWFVQRAFLGG